MSLLVRLDQTFGVLRGSSINEQPKRVSERAEGQCRLPGRFLLTMREKFGRWTIPDVECFRLALVSHRVF